MAESAVNRRLHGQLGLLRLGIHLGAGLVAAIANATSIAPVARQSPDWFAAARDAKMGTYPPLQPFVARPSRNLRRTRRSM